MNLSIIIPTLNEADYLASTIEHLRQNSSSDHEIIVIDSGSTDLTCEIADTLGVKLINYKGKVLGKAQVLNHAAGFASGEVFLFLDADTLVPTGFDISITAVLMDREVVGGAFEFTLDGPEFGLRVVELINRTRYRVRQRYYGDQGVFVLSDTFSRIGGYPEVSLFESAHLCKSLRKEGKLKLIRKKIMTSPRRFLDGGIYNVLWGDIKLWFFDLMGVSVEKYAAPYWKENELRSKD